MVQVTIPFDQFSDFWDDATGTIVPCLTSFLTVPLTVGKIIHSCASNSWCHPQRSPNPP